MNLTNYGGLLEKSKKVEYDKYVMKSEQSANALFNFMKKLEYLKYILENRAFIPRYNEEDIYYLGIENLDKMAFPMTCFCDICIQKIVHHCMNYGNIGIGMYKEWGISKGLQAIQYLNENSVLAKDLVELFNLSLIDINDNQESEDMTKYKNYLLGHIMFIKPLQGEMFINEEYRVMNFHDEKEWRYVPKFDEDMDLDIITQKESLNQNAYNLYSQVLKENKNTWLKFDYNDIKYLFVASEMDRDEVIKFISSKINIDEFEKYILISKIIVLDSIEEDM
ncbi:abortive infection system antitoxin AbiGi family protein [Clostridioides difficile]|uniref:abortive infection system antitoxin AbiGi family protein n=1 Tax=Clostridioides difficile TaxID=1496 RepID=UPI00097FF726|nr:abortive infection system antitoxin AbiGi family protein [Clostridioides difficile]SJO46568.1 Protein of uncharacterised function (DUF2743) [Clostridioides difficile]HBF4252061.1 hypothetical protein [Clostridioides difficile]